MSDARRLSEMAFPVPLAKEMAAQILAEVGNADRLRELGVVPLLAKELASQINAAGTISAPRLVSFSMPPEQAVEVAAQITANRGP